MLESINRSGLPITTGSASSSSQANDGTNAMLNQQDFLTLLTTQIKNQDPLAPMENGEFLAQMAQFSTVSGIQQVNDTLGGMSGGMRDMRMSMAANLLGHQVLVPGNLARADADGAINGVLDLPADTEAVIISYEHPETGEILHSETLGPQSAGLVGFGWTDIPADLVQSRQGLRVSASAVAADGSMTEVGPSVYARVISASAGASANDITLNVEDYGALNALEVESFR